LGQGTVVDLAGMKKRQYLEKPQNARHPRWIQCNIQLIGSNMLDPTCSFKPFYFLSKFISPSSTVEQEDC